MYQILLLLETFALSSYLQKKGPSAVMAQYVVNALQFEAINASQ